MAAAVFCMAGFSLLVSPFVRTREQVIPLGLVILRDRGIADVLPGVGVLLAYGAVCGLAGARLWRPDPGQGGL